MKNVPKLRFKGFSDEWEEKKLGDIVNSFEYGMNSPAVEYDGENKYIRITDIDEKTNRYINENVVSPGGELEDKYLVNENDILFARTGASTGKCYLYDKNDGKLYFAGFLIRANVNEENNAKFIFSQTKTNSYDKWVKIMSMRSGQPGINSQEYASYHIKIPSLKEQEKIANFLTKIDKLIGKQEEKVNNLAQYKKGMMQKIFSQEIRFKKDDGEEYPNWKENKFKDIIIEVRLGGNYENTDVESQYPLIKMGNLDRGNIVLNKIEYIPEQIDVDDEDKLKYGDLLFNTRNTLDLVGKVAIWRNELDVAYYNSNILRLKFDNNLFMNYLFNSNDILAKLKAVATGTTSVAAIYTRDLNNIVFNIPCLEEQNKIANFLNNIDSIIFKEKEKLEELTLWKKGLLQQMFI